MIGCAYATDISKDYGLDITIKWTLSTQWGLIIYGGAVDLLIGYGMDVVNA